MTATISRTPMTMMKTTMGGSHFLGQLGRPHLGVVFQALLPPMTVSYRLLGIFLLINYFSLLFGYWENKLYTYQRKESSREDANSSWLM